MCMDSLYLIGGVQKGGNIIDLYLYWTPPLLLQQHDGTKRMHLISRLVLYWYKYYTSFTLNLLYLIYLMPHKTHAFFFGKTLKTLSPYKNHFYWSSHGVFDFSIGANFGYLVKHCHRRNLMPMSLSLTLVASFFWTGISHSPNGFDFYFASLYHKVTFVFLTTLRLLS